MQTTFELCDKSKSVNGSYSKKSILIDHISCIDQDINLKSISINNSAWQFSVYVFGHTFTASSEAFNPTDDKLKSKHLKEVQKTLKDLLKVWNQIHNQQLSQKPAHCPN
jgi:hypothetical protein